ncbi:MAG: AAA family ATPase, partial [Atopobiaceae bacterium]|nr:AAA family ATPase [Atopobiaceae bacterium]
MDSQTAIHERLEQLPQGNLTRKTIKGHTYTYLQWREDGKVRSRMVREEELPVVKRLIAKRNCLERRLEVMRGMGEGTEAFNLDVYTGEELNLMCEGVSAWRERRICEDVRVYLRSSEPRVCVMYGLRRTGKSTAMLQTIAQMNDEDRGDAAFIEVKVSDTLDALLKDMKVLSRLGYRFVFVDEVTLLEDFSEGAAPLADVYARLGMRIVLSGTDSLSFWFAEGTSLYDRTTTIHTTWIPYREHARVLGTKSVDEYIRYGGTMHKGGRRSRSSFRDSDATYAYVDSAIAHNIQHGLEFYRDGRNMRNLVELWDADELTNVINRVVQQENHSFARKSIDRAFKSADLGSARQLLRARMAENSPLDAHDIDVEGVTASLMSALDVFDPNPT